MAFTSVNDAYCQYVSGPGLTIQYPLRLMFKKFFKIILI